MDSIRIDKEKSYINLLSELFFGSNEIPNQEDYFENTVIEIDENILYEIGYIDWKTQLGTSQYFDVILHDFQEELKDWANINNNLDKASSKEKMENFIDQNLNTGDLIQYKEGILSTEDIKEKISWIRPRISKFFHKWNTDFKNFLIFESELLNINLHLILLNYDNQTFNLTCILSVWLKDSVKTYGFNMENIQLNFELQTRSIELSQRLKGLGYNEVFLYPEFNVEKISNEKYYDDTIPSLNNFALDIPDLFITYAMSIMNSNPLKLFEEISQHYFIIEDFIKSQKYKTINNPTDWYNKLEEDLKVFLQNGKELFSKTSQILGYTPLVDGIEKQKKIESHRKKSKISVEKIILIFKEIRERDELNKTIENGFRSINKVYVNHVSKDLLSKQTFYTIFNENWGFLSEFLERSGKKGKGGADLYRYVKMEESSMKTTITEKEEVSGISDDNILVKKQNIQIQQALLYYNTKNYEKTIYILGEIVKNPTTSLKKDLDKYLGCWFYLGKAYFKLNKFGKALTSFKEILAVDEKKLDVIHLVLECYRYLRDYDRGLHLIEKKIEDLRYLCQLYINDNNKDYIISRDEYYRDYADLKIFSWELQDSPFLIKNLVVFNKKIHQLRLINIRLEEKGDWQDYHNKSENLSMNIYCLRKIIKFYQYFVIYKVEITRRLMLRDFLREDVTKFSEHFQDLINFLKVQKTSGYFNINLLNEYFSFFVSLTTNLNKKLKIEIIENIKKIFPEFIENKIGGTPFSNINSFNPVFRYLFEFLINYGVPYKKWFNEIDYYIFEVELLAGFLFVQIKSRYHHFIYNEYKKLKNELPQIQKRVNQTPINITTFWGYQIYTGSDEGSFRDLIQELKDISQNNNLKEFLDWSNLMEKKIEEGIENIKIIKNQGRNLALCKYLEEKRENYVPFKENFELDFSNKPDKIPYNKFIQNILEEIKKTIHYKIKNKTYIKLNLPNSSFTSEIEKLLKEEYSFPNKIETNKKNSSIFLTLIPTEFIYNKRSFLTEFLYAIKRGVDELIIEYKEEDRKDFEDYFLYNFDKDFDNAFFHFQKKIMPDSYSVHIIIKKKKDN